MTEGCSSEDGEVDTVYATDITVSGVGAGNQEMTEDDSANGSTGRKTSGDGRRGDLVLRYTECFGDYCQLCLLYVLTPITQQVDPAPGTVATFGQRRDRKHIGFHLDYLTGFTTGDIGDRDGPFLVDTEPELGWLWHGEVDHV